MAQFHNDILKRYVGPEIDVRPIVQLDDLSAEFAEARFWAQNYFLNSVLTSSFTGDAARYSNSLIVRVQIAFEGYQLARNRTIAYADGWQDGAPNVGRYLAAVGEWETVFINLQIALDLLAKWSGMKLSAPYDRTHRIANRIKHVSEDIRDGEIAEPGLPLWITESGLATTKHSLTFVEMTGQIRFLSQIADALSNPSGAQSKLSAITASRAQKP
jgi:hypothetical protein